MKNSEEVDLDKLEKLMQSKSYVELSPEEKMWVSKWVESSNDYDLLRKSENQIREYFQNSQVNLPDSTTLSQLTHHFKQKSNEYQVPWWQFKPSLATWSMAILFGCLGWWIGQSTNVGGFNTKNGLSIVRYDTIYVASQPDTIFTEKVIYRDRPVILTSNEAHKDFKNTSPESNGINMKEKEELEKLLVSGTE